LWCAAHTTKRFSRFSPRKARAETAVSSKPESSQADFEFRILNFAF
jgi:hypothetical protein